MKKVLLVHGLNGTPNGGWRPWLMAQLAEKDIYAASLVMKSPDTPKVADWVKAIEQSIFDGDEVYLVGHSLGVPTILRYLERDTTRPIAGAVLVSGPIHPVGDENVDPFLQPNFNYESIKNKCKSFTVIHGDDDPLVPVSDAHELSKILDAQLYVIPNGKHLNGSAGWKELPEALTAILVMIDSNN